MIHPPRDPSAPLHPPAPSPALALALAFAFTLALALPAGAAPPAPTLSLDIQRVDASAFPEVDVYFKVLDNVPNTPYRRLVLQDVSVSESGAGFGSFSPVPVLEDNFSDPQILPLGVAVAVDRSNSVSRVLEKLKEATLRFLNGMSDNGDDRDDATSLTLFAGPNSLRKTATQPLTTDKGVLAEFAGERMNDTASGTPLHKAWNLTLYHIQSARDYPVRGIFMLSDGKNWPPGAPPHIESIKEAAVSNGVQMFNFAFVKFRRNYSVRNNSVFRDDMIDLSRETNGAYFEPIPPFPVLPDLPTEPDDASDPDSIPDGDVIDYLRQVVGLIQNLLNNDPDASFSTFAPVLHQILEPDVADVSELNALDLTSEAPFLPAASETAYSDLIVLDEVVEEQAKATVSEADLESFYVDQVANMFDKARQGLKTLYRVRFRSGAEELDGSLRDVRVSVRYVGDYNSLPLTLEGAATARFGVPLVADEDTQVELTSSLNPGAKSNGMLFGSDPAPRGGSWLGPTEITWKLDLMTQEPSGEEPRGAGRVLVERNADGLVSLVEEPGSPVLNLSDDEKEDLLTCVRHLEMEAEADPAAGTLKVRMRGKVPTCIRSRESSDAGAPIASSAAPGSRSLLWYRVEPIARRAYRYLLRIPTADGEPGDDVETIDHVSQSMPVMVVYFADVTPPTMSLYLTPFRERELNRIESLELPVDSAAATPRAPSAVLHGRAWTMTRSPAFSEAASIGTTVFPLSLPSGTADGFHVAEDVRVEAVLLAKDNLDGSSSLDYLRDDGDPEPPSNRFEEGDPVLPEARTGQAPFLPMIPFEEIGTRSGAALMLNQDGERSPVGESLILRVPNVPTGDDVALEAWASDEAGNVSFLRVPVFVEPLDFRFRRDDYDQQRANDFDR